jgi:hypothetical protein
MRRAVLIAGVVLSAAFAPIASGSTASAVKITKVTFTGSSTAPVITVTGSGFGTRPTKDPNGSPAKASAGCRKQPLAGNGKDGSDYGPSGLGLGWGTARPSGYNAGAYVADEYLDCIGVEIRSYTSTKIVFSLGCQYALYSPAKAHEDFLIQVHGATKRGVISYS